MPEVYLGSLLLVPYNFVPAGWARCHGELLQISQNNALFALIGTTFGGDGVTTFALPDHRTNVPNGLHWIIALRGIFPSRD